MKKTNVTAIINDEIVERFSDKEMMVLVGGGWIAAIVAVLSGGGNIGSCVENSGNCAEGCACK